MAYASWSVVFGEQPTAAKWNILGTNDASFNNGTGIFGLYKNLLATDSNPYKFSVYRSGNQTVTASTLTKVQLNAENFDTNSNFDSSTNYRYTAPVAGFYFVNGKIKNNGNNILATYIYKNGTLLREGNNLNPATNLSGGVVCDLIQLAASDYIEMWVYSDNVTVTGGADVTYFSGFLVSRT
jgi:hypothetical protein